MPITNKPVLGRTPVIGEPPDQFETDYQNYMNKQPEIINWMAKVVTAFAAETYTDAQAAAIAKFQELDDLDNAGLITAMIESQLATVLQPNLLEYGGTFKTATAVGTDPSATYSDENSIMLTQNSTTVGIGGSFYHDNSTFGGTGTALSSVVEDLINATGRGATGTDGRYGATFNITLATMGAGTVGARTHSGLTKYRMFGKSRNQGRRRTAAYWIYSPNATLIVMAAVKNDVVLSPSATVGANGFTLINPADGWVHIVSYTNFPVGYEYPIEVYASENAQAYIAMPYIADGIVRLPKAEHQTPIPHKMQG